MEISQTDSDKLWSHYQNSAPESFDSSYSRLRYIAGRCRAGDIVLNVGVGSGYLESLLIKRDVIVYSLDPSELTVRRLNDELGMEGRARQGYCHSIPFPGEFFDAVILTEVLEHIPNEVLEPSLREIRRVLRQDGRLVGTVPYREVLAGNEVYCPRCHMQFHRWGHLRSFDKPSLRQLLEGCGFRIGTLYSRAFTDFRRPSPRQFVRAVFRYLLGRLGEPLVAPNLYFLARPH